MSVLRFRVSGSVCIGLHYIPREFLFLYIYYISIYWISINLWKFIWKLSNNYVLSFSPCFCSQLKVSVVVKISFSIS